MVKMAPDSFHLLTLYSDKLHSVIDWLAGYGTDPEGGITRLLYTRPWLQAQQALAAKMQQFGLEASFDPVGNLYGRLEGTNTDLKPVLTGSHIDTVKNAGKLDGAYGIVAGLLALAFLKSAYGTPKRTLEVVSLCEEEGSRFPLAYWGSGNVTGVMSLSDAEGKVDIDGVSLKDAMEAVGFGASSLAGCKREDLEAYIELHIEQGAVLERMGKQIGVVTGIVGQKRYTIRLEGTANHAGTTPMKWRYDALVGAAEMAVLVESMALQEGEPLVATVGRFEVKPGTPNVVPGEVDMTLDVRHTDEEKMNTFSADALARMKQIAEKRGLCITIQERLHVPPVGMNEGIMKGIEAVCESYELASMRIASGAGHDAQLFAECCKAAMIFVPSRSGISHNPQEYTAPEDLEAGFQTLVHLLYEYGYGGKADESL
ncbi:allantoate deiminase [Paenibacillus hexagrammi]|uniref:Allantoate deiminase n=1 Tax=Paenibacillus hexagrammi TaxID=2908839 RepID=A0ABY3SHW5_9BACL|nr:allantoate deiminase [Paenibacillus sp. YPD9-1]UJF32710.1 allantoate deiminase [Paenibacillus sp. YPD9-1]